VDKITWGGGNFLKKNNLKIIIFFKKRGADGLFSGKDGRGTPFLTGVENTEILKKNVCEKGNLLFTLFPLHKKYFYNFESGPKCQIGN
jgi:hypothetical protein